jgi:hypothetical protein
MAHRVEKPLRRPIVPFLLLMRVSTGGLLRNRFTKCGRRRPGDRQANRDKGIAWPAAEAGLKNLWDLGS